MSFRLPRGFRAISRRRVATSLQPIRAAVRSALETLESRQLMSADPAFSYAGASSANEGSTYSLALTSSNVDSGTQSWSIDWGDGQTQTYDLTGTSNTVTHVFADGPFSRTIEASVQYNSTNYDAAPTGTSGGGTGALAADGAFGVGGKVTTAFADNFGTIRATSILPNGKIVVAGDVSGDGPQKWVIARYEADGSLDTTFGPDHTGIITLGFGGDYAYASGLVTLPGGGAYVGGTVGSDVAIAKFLPDGTLDTSFSGGIVRTHVGDGDVVDLAGPLKLAGTKLVLGGTVALAEGDLFVAQFNAADGSLDTSFDADGSVVTDLGGDDLLADIAITSTDKIIVAGTRLDESGHLVELAQYDASGQLDTTFGDGADGSTLVNSAGSISEVRALALQSDGTILLGVDQAFPSSFLARFTAAGTPTGVQLMSTFSVTDLIVHADNSIVLGGHARVGSSGTDTQFALATTTGFGLPLSTALTTDFAAGADVPLQAVEGPTGEVVLAGYSDRDGAFKTFALARFVSAANPGPLVVTVNNVAPVVTVGTGINGVRQQDIAISASFVDPGAEGSWDVTVNYGDGAVEHLIVTSAGPLSLHHAYSTIGSYNVSVTVSDGDAGGTVTAGGTVNVSLYTYVPDPTAAGRNLLLVGGTSAADNITIDGQLFGRVGVTIGGTTYNLAAPSGGVVVYAGDGNDRVKTSGISLYPVVVFGQDGDDRLDGGIIGSILVGGDGNDEIHGGGLRDVLIGGAGGDKLVGNTGDDILIGGITAWDADSTALLRIWQEWGNFNTSYSTRISHLQGAAGGQNAGYFLKASGTGRTVFDDTGLDDLSFDTLNGGSGDDWYLANLFGSGTRDRINGSTRGEVTTDISAQ